MKDNSLSKFRKVAVLMGGDSSERDISMMSGTAVAAGLEKAGYDVARVEISGHSDLSLPDGTEAVFIALHGAFGEDGGVQNLLEQLAIPYTGSGPESSRVSFDKILARTAFELSGVPVPLGMIAQKGQPVDFSRIRVPLVVKPPRQGSSVGISIVKDEANIQAALDEAFIYGDEALIEDYIPGREWTVPIVGTEVLPIIEITPKLDGGWYSWNAKYKASGTTAYSFPEDDPANEEMASLVRGLALRAFNSVDARGLGRIDFRISSEDGKPYALELNSIPGFTETSLLPKAAAKRGIAFEKLCAMIMESAKCG